MPSWGNTDALSAKPKWDVERQVREFVQLATANTTNLGNTTITLVYNDGGQNLVANLGIGAGNSVFVLYNGLGGNSPQGSNGYPSMFLSNTTISSVSGNNITLSQGVFNAIATGTIIEIDKKIPYKSNVVANTYNSDTVLVTSTRVSAANNIIGGNPTVGWTHVRKKINNDGSVRYIRETLVALANPTASNTQSGNTSWGTAFANT